MNIGWAADMLRRGKRVRRKGWRNTLCLGLATRELSPTVLSFDGGMCTGGIAWTDADLFATDWTLAP